MTKPVFDRVTIRRAVPGDRDAILALVPRLVAFGPPAWRDAAAMSVTDRKVIGAALQSSSEDPIVLAAVSGNKDHSKNEHLLGFVHLCSAIDYYTGQRHGHVADIVVAEAYEGRGIGRQLLAAAEDWARSQRYEWLTISVFPGNARAARMYEEIGFRQDTVRLLKPLR